VVCARDGGYMFMTALARRSTCGGQFEGTMHAQGERGSRGRGRGGLGPVERKDRTAEYEEVGQQRAAENTSAVIA
jgi:hypothetical protein